MGRSNEMPGFGGYSSDAPTYLWSTFSFSNGLECQVFQLLHNVTYGGKINVYLNAAQIVSNHIRYKKLCCVLKVMTEKTGVHMLLNVIYNDC